MSIIIIAIAMLGFAGVTTLATCCMIGGDPLYVAPLALLTVAATWAAHDLIIHLCRKHRGLRAFFTWAYTPPRKERLREVGALITMLQLWFTVSIVPALLVCWVGHVFSDYVPPWSFGQCLGSSMLLEAFMSLALDAPSGFVGIANRLRGKS